jgi:biotin carboxylase
MKRIMILGANILQIPLISKANSYGYETIVVSPNTDEPGHKLATHSIRANVRDEEAILHFAKQYKIDGIITDQTDIAVRSVAYVAEKMGLPGIGYQTACLFTDKFAMREKCRELGIKTLKYKLVQNVNESIEILEELGGTAILKPIDNQGSKGVSLIDSPSKMKIKFKEAMEYSKQKKALVEEVARGREFVVEGLAFDGKFQNLIIGDTYYFDKPDVFAATQRIFPTNADFTLRQRVAELNEKIISGFGLKQGISHSEFIMNGDDIILIETAARGGGVFISSDLIYLATGLCTEDFLLKIATGTLSAFPVVQQNKCACCYLAFFLPVGEVISTDGIEDVIRLPYTHRHNLDTITIGMKTRPYTDKTSRFFIIVSADTRKELNDRISRIREQLNAIKVKCNDGNIKTPIWQ